MKDLKPKIIVQELDKYIVGQHSAKKAVAVAFRNRWRSKNIKGPIKDEILPHNILMEGPTGVGKTEIARRLAKISGAPFLKVEATKFTEVGYVGRDVESIIRDLLDVAVKMVRDEMREKVQDKATSIVKNKILTSLVGKDASDSTIKIFSDKLEKGDLDQNEIELLMPEAPTKQPTSFEIPGMGNAQMGILNISDMFGKAFGEKKEKLIKLKVIDAKKRLLDHEIEKLLDESFIIEAAIELTEKEGIVFIDEIDKVSSGNVAKRHDANREGVQRDLLPIIEGTSVTTKHGIIKTDRILFIAAGSFHLSRPSDLLPELQGRLPVRVKLDPLSESDLVNILSEPRFSLPKQHAALLEVEGVVLNFKDDGILAIARLAAKINSEIENIGARRLCTLIEKMLEKVSFSPEDYLGSKSVDINEKFVLDNLPEVFKKEDRNKFIL